MADDARIVIDADARAVVVEAKKSKAAINDLSDTVKKAAAEAKVYQDAQGRWREENGRFVTSARKVELGLGNQTKATQASTKATDQWTRVQAAGTAAGRRQVQTMHELGRAARASTLALGGLAAAGLTHLIKTGVDFEKQMSAVGAVTDANAKQFEALRKSAIAAGRATIFSAGDAAKAQEELAKGGLSVKNILDGGLNSALHLASAGSLELADAAAITANAMNLFNIGGKDSAKVADAFATAANSTTADVADFGLALAQGGAVAKMAGLSFKETMTVLEALAKSGVKSSDAGTSLKTALIQLLKPTSTQAKMAQALHLSFVDANGEMKSMVDISAMLRDRLDGMGKAQRTAVLATLAGTDGVRTLNALYDAGPSKLASYEKALAKTGTAAEVAKKKQDNVAGAFENLRGSIETVEVSLFHQFQEPLKQALLAATNEVNTKGKVVEEFFNRVFDMPEFKAADLGGKLRILLDEFDKTGLPAKMRDLIVQGFTDGLNAAVPVMIAGAEKLALEGAKAFGRAFIDADPLSRVLLTGYLLHKTGALAAFRAYGKTAGATVATEAAVGATGGAASAGWKGAAKSMGKQFGIAAAVAAGVAYGPEFAGKIKRQSSGDTPKFQLPKHSGGGAITDTFGIASAVSDLVLGGGELKKFGDTAEQTFKQLAAAKDTRALSGWSDEVRDMARHFPEARTQLNAFADALSSTAGNANDQFRLMQGAAGKSLKAISQVLADTQFEIEQRFGPSTEKAKDALAQNFMLAAQAIRKSMNDGKISTRTGMREIEDLFVKALAAYGFTKAEAINRAHGKEFSGKSSPGGTTHTNAARGALMQVGRAGAAGVDNVPAVLNGQRAMVADGEQIAVFNRHQQQDLNQRLADTGGLAGFFASNRRPHYMAAGGMVGRANRLDHMHLPYKWGGGHGSSTGFDSTGMDCSATVSYILGIPPRTSGDLMGFGRPGPGPVTIYANPQHTFMSIKGRGFGTSGENPGGGPGWLSYSARGGFAVSHVGLGAADQLRKVAMAGGLGAVSTLGQRALDLTRSAAQQRLDGLSAPGMDPGGALGTANAGDWRGALKDIATERGWSASDWLWIISHESGGSTTAKNPKSTAYGLGQLLDMNYKRLGGGPGSSGGEQIRAMASYITERYGNPTAARSYWQAHQSYATGGLLNSTGATPKPKGPSAKGKKKPGRMKPLTLNQVRKRLGERLKQGYPVKGIDELENLVGDNGTVERLKKDLDHARQLHDLTDEEKIRTIAGVGKDAQGSPNPDVDVLNTDGYTDDRGHFIGGIKQHTAEDLAELMKAGMIQGGYDTAIRDLPRLKKEIEEGISERNARVKLIARLAVLELRRRKALEESIKRLQRRKITTAAARRSAINDAAGSADADKTALRDQISNLQDQMGGATGTDKLALQDQIKAKREQIAAVGRRITTLRRSGGDTGALNLHVLALKDDLAGVKGSMEHWVGTSSDDAGDSSAWGSRSVGGALRQDLANRWRPSRDRLASLAFDLPDQRFAAMIDVATIRKDYEDWRDTPAPKPADLTAGGGTAGDSGLADLLKAQLDQERQRTGMLASQFDVFKDFAPLLQGRMLGSFARGLARVPETGLAVLHKDETVLSDPQGPFGFQRAGVAPAPVQVTVHLDSDLRPFVSRMRAEIDGRAARVVSEQLGRNARLMVSARGG